MAVRLGHDVQLHQDFRRRSGGTDRALTTGETQGKEASSYADHQGLRDLGDVEGQHLGTDRRRSKERPKLLTEPGSLSRPRRPRPRSLADLPDEFGLAAEGARTRQRPTSTR